jgi:hypothetical protein
MDDAVWLVLLLLQRRRSHTRPRSPGIVASMHLLAGRESCRAEQGQGEQGKDRRGRVALDVGP